MIIAVLAGVGIWLGTRPPTNNHREATTNPTTPTTPPPAPTVPPDRPGLDPAQHRTNQHHHGRPQHPTGTFERQPENEPLTLSDPNCRGVLFAGQLSAYAGSGYSAMSARVLQEPQSTFDHWVYQGAGGLSVRRPRRRVRERVGDQMDGLRRANRGPNLGQQRPRHVEHREPHRGTLKIAMLNIQPKVGSSWACQRCAQRGIQRGHRRHCVRPENHR